MRQKLFLTLALLVAAVGMKANSEVYITKNVSYAEATGAETVNINSADYTVAGTYTLTTEQVPNLNYDYTVLSVPYSQLTEALGTEVTSSNARAMFAWPKSDGTYEFNQTTNWYDGSGYYTTWASSDARFFIEDNHATAVADNFSFYVGQHKESGKTSSIGDSYKITFYCIANEKAVRFNLTLKVTDAPTCVATYTCTDTPLHTGYTCTYYSVSNSEIATALGLSEADFTANYKADNSGSVTMCTYDTTNNVYTASNDAGEGSFKGYWMNADGKRSGYSGGYFYFVYDLAGRIGIGQYPNKCTAGSSYTFYIIFKYGTKMAVVKATYNVTNKKTYEDAVATANEALASSDYASVTGTERTNLQSAVNATVEETEDGWNTAAANINTALEAFKAAVLTFTAAGTYTCTDTPLHTSFACTYYSLSNSGIATALGLSEADFTAKYKADNSGDVTMCTYDTSNTIVTLTDDAGEGDYKGYWMNADGLRSGYNGGSFYFVYDPAGRIGIGQKPSTCANGSSYTFHILFKYGTKVADVTVTYNIERSLVMVNSAATDKAWTSTSATGTIYGGDYLQLDGVKMTFGSSDDENTTWTWNAGNTSMIPSQMPSTDGTASTLITSFSETEFGTLPTRGNFFKVEATESGLLTITCKPSQNNAQTMWFVEMDGNNIAKASSASYNSSYYNYEVEAGKTYYVFQLAYSGQLSGYRYTLRGISFQKQILSEDATYTPDDMVGITALTLKRTIGANKWNTIVLPVALTNAQLTAAFGANVKVAELTEASTEALTFQSVTATEANKPYMIYVDQDFSEATITGITMVDGTPSQTVGTATFIGSYNALTDIPEGAYFASNNQVVKAGTGCTMKGTRAYFIVASEARSLNFVFDGNTTTGIGDLQFDNVLFDGNYFDLQGRKIANSEFANRKYKGLYIHNGRKVLFK